MFEPITWRLKLLLAHPASAKYAINRRFYNLTTPLFRRKKVKCNICNWEGNRFLATAGANFIRYNSICPVCGSAERNRALIEYLNKKGDSGFKQNKYLDIGPIKGARAYFEARNCDYISIDLDSDYAMVKMDATNLQFPDSTFDVIICSHVLEHVKDDLQAVKEMARVMKAGGACYIMVPFSRDKKDTLEYEKPNPRDPLHVRSYGMDVIDRIESAGFKVNEINLAAEAGEENARQYGLGTEEICFMCRKN